jgi:hypothetical protein
MCCQQRSEGNSGVELAEEDVAVEIIIVGSV